MGGQSGGTSDSYSPGQSDYGRRLATRTQGIAEAGFGPPPPPAPVDPAFNRTIGPYLPTGRAPLPLANPFRQGDRPPTGQNVPLPPRRPGEYGSPRTYAPGVSTSAAAGQPGPERPAYMPVPPGRPFPAGATKKAHPAGELAGHIGSIMSDPAMQGSKFSLSPKGASVSLPLPIIGQLLNALGLGGRGGQSGQGGGVGGLAALQGGQGGQPGQGGMPQYIQPAGGGGMVPITNSMYDPRTGQFTGGTGVDWWRRTHGGGAAPVPGAAPQPGVASRPGAAPASGAPPGGSTGPAPVFTGQPPPSGGYTAPDRGAVNPPSIPLGGAPVWGVKNIPSMVAGDLSSRSTYAHKGEPLASVNGFVVHHTGGRGTPESIMNTFNQRGFPAQYIMDRDGKIYSALPEGTRGSHIQNAKNGSGLNNRNALGMEIIAKNDADVTPAQKQAAAAFIEAKSKQYGFPSSNVYGHGEVNPGHKEADEGLSVARMVRSGGGGGGGGVPSPQPSGGGVAARRGRGRAGESGQEGGFNYDDYAKRVSGVESAGGTNLGKRGNEYQMGAPEIAQYGSGPEGMRRMTEDYYRQMTTNLGRSPTPQELYLAHQQGVQGATKLLNNPDMPAGKVVPPSHIIGNGGDPNMLAKDYVAKQFGRYDEASGGDAGAAPRAVPGVSTAAGQPQSGTGWQPTTFRGNTFQPGAGAGGVGAPGAAGAVSPPTVPAAAPPTGDAGMQPAAYPPGTYYQPGMEPSERGTLPPIQPQRPYTESPDYRPEPPSPGAVEQHVYNQLEGQLRQEAPAYGGRSGGSGLLGMLGGMDKSFRGKRQQEFERSSEGRIREQVKLAKDEATTNYKDWEDGRKEWNRREEDRVKQENIYRTDALREARGEHKEAVTEKHREQIEVDKERTRADVERRSQRAAARTSLESKIHDLENDSTRLRGEIKDQMKDVEKAKKELDDNTGYWADKDKHDKAQEDYDAQKDLLDGYKRTLKRKEAAIDAGEKELEKFDTDAANGRGNGAAAPSGNGAAKSLDKPTGGTLAEARKAIARGAPREAIIQKMIDNGIDPSGL